LRGEVKTVVRINKSAPGKTGRAFISEARVARMSEAISGVFLLVPHIAALMRATAKTARW